MLYNPSLYLNSMTPREGGNLKAVMAAGLAVKPGKALGTRNMTSLGILRICFEKESAEAGGT